jgi:hypothetical protein
MPSGRSIRNSIHTTLTKEARQQKTWQNEAAEIDRRMLAAKHKINEHLQSLSRVYLADKDSEHVRSVLGPILTRADESLEARQKIFAELSTDQPIVEQTLARLNQDCDRLQAERDALISKTTSADEAARATPEFQQVWGQREAMIATIAANKTRAESLKELSRKKLVSYQANRVFSYLLKRKYSRPDYSANALAARLDAMAARSVNFSANYARYQALIGIPDHVDQDVARREDLLKEFENGPLADAEKSAREKAGYFPIKSELDDTQSQFQERIAEREKTQNQLLAIQQKLASIVAGTDEHLVQATQLVSDFLSTIPETHLQQIAEGTPDKTDDAHVGQILVLRASLTVDIDRAKTLAGNIEAASQRVSRLQKLEQEFRRRDYDGSYSNFPSLDINTLLTGYLLGQINNDRFFSTVGHHYVDDTPTVVTSSSWGDSSSSSGGGFGGDGGFSSGGGFGGDSGGGGGGFSSGDGF